MHFCMVMVVPQCFAFLFFSSLPLHVCSAKVTISDSSNVCPNVIIAKNNIMFTSEDLDLGRSYNVTVLARNIGGSATS